MKFNIIWSEFAVAQLDQIYESKTHNTHSCGRVSICCLYSYMAALPHKCRAVILP